MSKLVELIKEEITMSGPVTFARFMEQALYHPQYGYYSAPEPKIGRSGDFYTAPTVSPIFGAMLARQFSEMWSLAGRPDKWILAEYGPGTGVLARDIINAIYQHHPDLFTALEYYLIEISPTLREAQKRELSKHAPAGTRVYWVNSPVEIDGAGISSGCVLANELIDALPVHLVTMTGNGLMELFVDQDKDGNFNLIKGSLSSTDLKQFFAMQNIELSEGQKAEVNLQAYKWMSAISTSLRQGFLIVIDYGTTTSDMYSRPRFNGTLRCFHKHQLVDNPLINIGMQDITANVNFSTLITWGEQLGLKKIGLVTQPNFLLNMGILDILQQQKDFTYNPEINKLTSAIKQLVLPGGMGDIFKVLIQCKGFDPLPKLTGVK